MDSGTGSHEVPMYEYHKIELQEVFERTRARSALRLQIATFLGTANITILGAALSFHKAGLFVISAMTVVVLVIVEILSRDWSNIWYDRGLELEARYAPDYEKAILHRRKTERKAGRRHWRTSVIDIWIPLIVMAGEIGTGFLMWQLGWPLF